jgi:hypothetical protein
MWYKGRDSALGITENSQANGSEHTIVSSVLKDLIFKLEEATEGKN